MLIYRSGEQDALEMAGAADRGQTSSGAPAGAKMVFYT
ncbi:hypothetical protein ATHSA_0691 [Athalassotoga saccharophila]|nr:hypothetical protein ATHSA_0691 [Athalassotoga saccharophila]